MASFTEVMRQARRMCKIESKKLACKGCPRKKESCIPKTNATFELGDDEAYERDVMQWAKEHPEPKYPTWNEWYHKTFPECVANGLCFRPCAFILCKSISCPDCCNEPIPVEIAVKLGIKPIGGEKDG